GMMYQDAVKKRSYYVFTDPNSFDTDRDWLSDGLELGLTAPQSPDTDMTIFVIDYDPSTHTNPKDDDTDDDGWLDGMEDPNFNGSVENNEIDPNMYDTDSDGLSDGVELCLAAPQGENTDMSRYQPDEDTKTTTNPLDDDCDDDGLLDGYKDLNGNMRWDPGEIGEDISSDGKWDYYDAKTFDGPTTEDGGYWNGGLGPGESDPHNPDTDNDTLPDGQEMGLTDPQGDYETNTDGHIHHTDLSKENFQPDADSGDTKTNPLDSDTDEDGLPDGWIDKDGDGWRDVGEYEDYNLNGKQDWPYWWAWVIFDFFGIRLAETCPTMFDTDEDALSDALEQGITTHYGDTYLPKWQEDLDTSSNENTNPLDDDTDDDGLLDGFLNENGNLNANLNPVKDWNELGEDINMNGKQDSYGGFGKQWNDGQGPGETHPRKSDTDGDNLPDGLEAGLTSAQGKDTQSLVPGSYPYQFDTNPNINSNPLVKDSDGDNLDDGFEDDNKNGHSDFWDRHWMWGADWYFPWGRPDGETRPDMSDTDRDGLTDRQEDRDGDRWYDKNEANPLDSDSDNDGIKDGTEPHWNVDRDGDGWINARDVDSDGDDSPGGWGKLYDNREYYHLGTNMESTDSDGDGWSDHEEVYGYYYKRHYYYHYQHRRVYRRGNRVYIRYWWTHHYGGSNNIYVGGSSYYPSHPNNQLVRIDYWYYYYGGRWTRYTYGNGWSTSHWPA
ncbi:MAG: hypothetical protein JSW28_07425, partial [Thermoplasmata archaeon]